MLRRFPQSRLEFWRIWGLAVVVGVAGFGVAAFYVKPAPPARITIATGPSGGNYFGFAERYRGHFAEAGIELEIRETEGSRENYRLLADDASGVAVAIVQGGVAERPLSERVQAVGSVYLEPLWIFHRGGVALGHLDELEGMVIAAGSEGSGVRALAEELFRESGLEVAAEGEGGGGRGAGTRFVALDGQEAAAALRRREVDAAVFVLSPTNPLVRTLIEEPEIGLMRLELAEAYRRRMPHLAKVNLAKGVLDIAAPLPPEDVTLLAPAANLVVRSDVHPAILPVLIEAAREVHGRGGLVSDDAEFPSLELIEFPPHPAAEHYYENGASFLFRVLPFWAASLLDRMKIFLLPMLTLLLPMLRIAPPLYRWRIRRRIYRWYRVLRGIEDDLSQPGRAADPKDELRDLRRLEREVNSTMVPLAYMEEFYQLRLHIEMTRDRVAKRSRGVEGAG